MDNTLIRVIELALFIPAIVLHEVSHGYVSYRLGDPTAKMKGRLSLNPVKHVDPFGTVLLPLLLWFSGAPIFGYAKPVPINPAYYKDYRKGMMLTGLSGPATNLILAFLAGMGSRVLALAPLATGSAADPRITVLGWLWYALYYFGQINLVLMFFNLIPIPPLDGSRVLPLFLSDKALMKYHEIERYGIVIFFGLLLLLPRLLPGLDLLGGYFDLTVDPLMRLFFGL